MNFAVITLFPQMFSDFSSGLTQTAQDKGVYSLDVINLRDYGKGVHKAVDDEPFGGGDGMLLQCEPLYQALNDLKNSSEKWQNARVVSLSPRGKLWSQSKAQAWVRVGRPCVFVCGRYAGVDQRFVQQYCDEEISIGDYVLNGGELGALVVMDSMARLLEGTLGNFDSSIKDSFSENHLLEHPQYTRPQVWQDKAVPKTLVSGNHENIKHWKASMALLETALRRPELLQPKDKLSLQTLLTSKVEIDKQIRSDFGLEHVNEVLKVLEEKK